MSVTWIPAESAWSGTGKTIGIHLPAENFLQAHSLLRRAEDAERVAGRSEGLKKGRPWMWSQWVCEIKMSAASGVRGTP
jgi:hypothetical protein